MSASAPQHRLFKPRDSTPPNISLQRKAAPPSALSHNFSEVPPSVREILRSPGQPLDAATREFMEPRFRHDFSRVCVHSDGEAARSADALFARAYTIGNHVAFGFGEDALATAKGKRLLAHELAHVAQQGNIDNESLSARLRVGDSDDPSEYEANWIADAVVGAGPVPQAVLVLEARGQTIQRKNGGKAKAPPPWTVDELKKMLDSCDGGLGIWAKAKKANGDKNPTIVPGAGGQTDTSTGTITLDQTQDKCFAVQQLIQELSNLSRKADFDKLDTSALAGDVSRADYIKQTEKIEYETGVKNVLTAFDACKDKWPCKTTPKEWARKAKDFDDYFKNFLSNTHKGGYGKWWDENCKAAYDKKHAKK